jgi:hypothetical protein
VLKNASPIVSPQCINADPTAYTVLYHKPLKKARKKPFSKRKNKNLKIYKKRLDKKG